MSAVTLAYHPSAEPEVSQVRDWLREKGYPTSELLCDAQEDGAVASMLLFRKEEPKLLFLNDGFLHSLACQIDMLAAVQQLTEEGELTVVLAKSSRHGPGGAQARILTSLSRVSDVIRYMNHWQNAYLKRRRELGATATAAGADELAPIRAVSQEIGETLRLLRAGKLYTVEELLSGQGQSLSAVVGPAPEAEVLDLPEEVTPEAVSQDEEQVAIADADPEQEGIDPHGESATESPFQENEELEPDILPETTTTAAVSSVAGAGLALAGAMGIDEDVDVPEVHEGDVEEVHTPDPLPAPLPESIAEKKPVEPSEEQIQESSSPHEEVEKLPEPSENLPINPVIEQPSAIAHTDDEPTLAELAAKVQKRTRKQNAKQFLALYKAGDFESAKSFGGRALTEDANNDRLRYFFGVALLDSGGKHNEEEARHHLAQLTEGRYAAQASYALGTLALQHRNYGSARRHLKLAYKLNRKLDRELSYRLGALVQDEFPERRKEARRYLKRAVRDSKNNTGDAWYRLAQLQIRRGKATKAISSLKTALSFDRDHPFAAYDLALVYLRRERATKAFRYFERAVASNPELDTADNRAAFTPPTPEMEQEKFQAYIRDYDSAGLPQGTQPATEHQLAEVPRASQNEWPKSSKSLTVLITGASSGIGAATAREFARYGHRLILTGRRVEKLREVSAELIADYESQVRLLSFDVTQADETKFLLESLPDEWSTIDVLVNNAGKAKGFDFIHEGSLEHWEEMIDTNIKGLLYMTRLVSPSMVERGRGHIINVCSTAGHEVYPKGAVYCATKHAVSAITEGTRLDLHSHGIRVSQVSPAHVEETEFARVRFDGDKERAAQVYKDFQPLRAHDVARSVYFIASQPSHVNVQDVLLMGTQQANSTTIARTGR